VTTQEIVGERGQIIISDPPLARTLFSSTRLAWLWLIIRIYTLTNLYKYNLRGMCIYLGITSREI